MNHYAGYKNSGVLCKCICKIAQNTSINAFFVVILLTILSSSLYTMCAVAFSKSNNGATVIVDELRIYG